MFYFVQQPGLALLSLNFELKLERCLQVSSGYMWDLFNASYNEANNILPQWI